MNVWPILRCWSNFTTSVGSRALCWPWYTDFSLFTLPLLTSSLETMITTTVTRGHCLTTNVNMCRNRLLAFSTYLVTVLIVKSDDWYFVGLRFPLFLVQHQWIPDFFNNVVRCNVLPTRNQGQCWHNKVISWKHVYVWSWFLKFWSTIAMHTPQNSSTQS